MKRHAVIAGLLGCCGATFVQGSPRLAWSDNSSNETCFKIERSENGTAFSEIAMVGANITSFVDSGAVPGAGYWYRVRASNTAGNSGYTNIVQVFATNSAPTVGTIADQTMLSTQAVLGPVSFSIGDLETAAVDLVVVASSSNPAVVAPTGIQLGGSGSTRTISLAPLGAGVTTISVTVSDGNRSATTTFSLTVQETAASYTFSNTASITVPKQGAASPYGSAINVAGTTGPIETVVVRINGFSHASPADVDILLVSPTGKAVLLLSDAGTRKATGVNLVFADSASSPVPATGTIQSGTYKPTNHGTSADLFPSPAPGGPYLSSFASIVGTAPDGVWRLYVVDDQSRNSGVIASGWSLTITTSPQPPVYSLMTPPQPNFGVLASRAAIAADRDATITFTVAGSSSKSMLLRAVGPGLAALGVSNPAPAPRLSLSNSASTVIFDSGAWDGSAALSELFARLGAMPLDPGSADVAVAAAIPPGQYAARGYSADASAGVVMLEVYDADTAEPARLTAIGAQQPLLAANERLSASFAVLGTGQKRVLVLGVRPSLSGITPSIGDPAIAVYDSQGVRVASNDNWSAPVTASDATPAEIANALVQLGLVALPPSSPDAALIMTVGPGVYSAEVASADATAGAATIAIFELQ